MFYWGKLYLEGIKQGEDYRKLNKVITINLLDFNFLGTKDYHSSFHLWEDVERELLEELMQMEPAIKMAEEKLDFLGSDPEMIELYKAREYSAHERANLVSTGIEKGKIEVAIALLDILDDEMIATKTGLEIKEVQKLRSEYESR